jgi:hypothetical protein
VASKDIARYPGREPERVVIEGELVDDTCEFPGCGEPGELAADPITAELGGEEVLVSLCPRHLQARYNDV